jgi:putative SOS response-associated peptidase YedK
MMAAWFVVIEYKLCRRRHNLYSITTNQEAIIRLFRVMNRYVGNLPPMPGVFPDYPAPVVRNAGADREMLMMRWGMPPPPRAGGFPVTNIRNTTSPHWRGWLKPESRCLVPANSFAEYAPEPNPATGTPLDWPVTNRSICGALRRRSIQPRCAAGAPLSCST